MSPRPSSPRGLTLIEVLVVVVVAGILAAATLPAFGRLGEASRETAAVTRARLLNTARQSYALTDPGAVAAWAAAADDSARLGLLRAAGLLDAPGAGALVSAGGFTLELSGAVRERTILRRAGVEVPYD